MPSRVTPRLREVAQQLLASEAAAGNSGVPGQATAFRVCEKLRLPLGRLLGVGGYHALLSRALVMASTEVSWLDALKVQRDGSWQGLRELDVKLGLEEIAAGEAALVAQLLGLLVTFIGPALTRGLVQEAWPNADFSKPL